MVQLSDRVQEAISARRPVVALESTIFSNLGLPSPHNAEALERCVMAIEAGGGVAAVTAVLDGVARVGIDSDEHHRILGPGRKVAARDLPVAIGQRWDFGATTVSASLALAAQAGISVFATGGMGGVHRGAELTHDVSADLTALARNRVVCVSAGAKAFLDLGRTLEYLETLSVPVLGWQTDRFPAFYTRDSGFPVPHRVESAAEVAAIHTRLTRGGLVLAVPIPAQHELDPGPLNEALHRALSEAEAGGLAGAAITPFVLGRIAEATGGESVPANLALAENNARVAVEVAAAVAELAQSDGAG